MTGSRSFGPQAKFFLATSKYDGLAFFKSRFSRYVCSGILRSKLFLQAKHLEVNRGILSHSMLLYQLFTNWYVVDYFIFEEFVTSTWDIIAEKYVWR